jgi:cobalt-zinc-cadmium efflux system outer membrane protein
LRRFLLFRDQGKDSMAFRRSLAAISIMFSAAAVGAGETLPVGDIAAVPGLSAAPTVTGERSVLRRLSLADAERLWHEHNRELRLADSAVSGAEADLRSAGQTPNPQASLNVGSISPHEGFGAGGVRDKRMDSVVRLEQLLERGNKRDLRVQGAAAMLDAARGDRADVGRQQRRALSTAFYDLLLAQEAERVAVDTAALYRQSGSTSEVRYRAGDISGAEWSRLRVEQQRAENDARQAQAATSRSRVALAYLIGQERNATALVAVDAWPAVTDTVDAGAGEPARRPDVRAARARVEAFERARDLARSLKTRDITLGVQLEHNLQNAPSNSFGFGVSAPLFVHHEYEGEIARAEADLQTARELYEQTLAQAQGEIDQAGADLSASRERRQRFEAGLLADAEHVVRSAEFAYARGATSLLDLLDARRTWRQVQLEAVNARADHARALAAWRAATAE